MYYKLLLGSYLHFFDNKRLPQFLEPDVAKSQDHWWYDPK